MSVARDTAIDADIAVDDARRDVDTAIERFRVAVVTRDRAEHYLASLVDLAEDADAVAETFWPEITDRPARLLLEDAERVRRV